MEIIKIIFDFIIHIDRYLVEISNDYGNYIYIIIFLIIFAETGFVVTPFLPGDSLLFALGSLTALENSNLNLSMFMILLSIAAILGDSTNYSIGKLLANKLENNKFKFINREHIKRTNEYFAKYGGKTIIIARFIPIIRTYAPFVAGVGSMKYGRFLLYNIVGGIIWINSFLILGYLFSGNEYIRKNFTLVIFAIIFISILPILYELIKNFKKNKL